MIDNIAHFLLSFSHDTIIIPLLVVGYIWINQRFFINALYLILIGILLNCVLKITFKVPLSSHLNKDWYAFPSGHMQTSCVFYGWLMTGLKNPVYKCLLILLLVSIGWALVHCGYHNYTDILGAVFFAGLTILGYLWLIRLNRNTFHGALLGLSTILLMYITHVYHITEPIQMAYCTLIGLMVAERLFNPTEITLALSHKIISTLVCFTLILVIMKAGGYFIVGPYKTIVQSLLMGFCLPFSVYISRIIYKEKSV